ncbi:chemotaxis protein CheD [Anaeromyxobacter oryzae]|uniref:Probable chemoreceptor glutamine deamidase CheD n=1 Tax=Anaeromyxobacter oryzae TaxID=2918170 RepID=A0ABM7WUB5_9BACT|nr:chemotaxis protein CheD [Anaeromyxobacter oryzae]BDG03086.1 putative chemoreceptor glutamine deamidase CheD [Anaeromyxobacter oryzae]
MSSTAAALRSPETAVPQIYVQPGQVHVFAAPTEAVAILGSCVAVCLWDPYAGLAGMNHFMLPNLGSGVGAESCRHGTLAMRTLHERLLAAGALAHRLRARVYGGATIGIAVGDPENHLGTRNARLAVRALEEKAIPIVGRDVGGAKSRKLVFLATGEAQVSSVG